MIYPTGIIRPPNAHIIENGEVCSVKNAFRWLASPDVVTRENDLFIVEGVGFSYAAEDESFGVYRDPLPTIEHALYGSLHRRILKASQRTSYGLAWNTLYEEISAEHWIEVFFHLVGDTDSCAVVALYFDVYLESARDYLKTTHREVVENIRRGLRQSKPIGARYDVGAGMTDEEYLLKTANNLIESHKHDRVSDFLISAFDTMRTLTRLSNSWDEEQLNDHFVDFIRANASLKKLFDICYTIHR